MERLVSTNAIARLGIIEQGKKDIAINGSSVYQRFLATAQNPINKPLKDNDWLELEALVNREYSNFSKILRSLVRLSLDEYRMCLLIKVKIPAVSIAKLLNVDDSTIGSRRNRLQKKHFGKGKAKDWDSFIMSID